MLRCTEQSRETAKEPDTEALAYRGAQASERTGFVCVNHSRQITKKTRMYVQLRARQAGKKKRRWPCGPTRTIDHTAALKTPQFRLASREKRARQRLPRRQAHQAGPARRCYHLAQSCQPCLGLRVLHAHGAQALLASRSPDDHLHATFQNHWGGWDHLRRTAGYRNPFFKYCCKAASPRKYPPSALSLDGET